MPTFATAWLVCATTSISICDGPRPHRGGPGTWNPCVRVLAAACGAGPGGLGLVSCVGGDEVGVGYHLEEVAHGVLPLAEELPLLRQRPAPPAPPRRLRYARPCRAGGVETGREGPRQDK
jgi:hypothetical protein